MKRKTVLAFTTGAACTASLALLIAAAPTQDGTEPDIKVDQPAEIDMMAEMAKLATPNEHHAKLMKTVGTWTAHSSFITDPSAPPTESTGTMVITSVLEGRYVMGTFKMDIMGQPYEGISFAGYDIAHEQYISTWADTMSTKITYFTGNYDQDGNLVMVGIATTPMGDNPMKIVTSSTDDDNIIDKFYNQTPDGSWTQSGTITYTRD